MLHVNLPDGSQAEIVADLGRHEVTGSSGKSYNVIVSGRQSALEYLVSERD